MLIHTRSVLLACVLLASHAKAGLTLSGVSLADNATEFLERFRNDDGGNFYIQSLKQTTSVQVTVKLSAESVLDLEEISPDSSASISLGNLHWSGTLGADPSYTYENMASKRSVYVRTHFHPFTGLPAGSNGVRLFWSATHLTISITSANMDMLSVGSPLAESLIVSGAAASPVRAVNSSIPLNIRFGPINLSQKKLFIQGTSVVKAQTLSGQVYNFHQISLTGAADITAPTITVNVPNRGIAEPGQQVKMTGKVVDGHGISRIGIIENGVSRELTAGVTTIKGPPSGASANWWGSVEKTFEVWVSPSLGANNIVIWSEDVAGNRTEKTVRITVALPAVLTGRWDALIAGERVGYLILQVTPQGIVTGSLRLDGMASAKSLTGLWTGQCFEAWADRGKSSQLYLFGQISTPGDISIGGVRSLITVATSTEGSDHEIGSGSAFRAPYSATNKLAANSPYLGRFHTSLPGNVGFPVVGAGYFSMVTTQAGVNTVTGKLGDGTSVTGAGIIGASGQAGVFVSLYGNKGCVLIESSLQDMTSTPYWSRPPGLPDRQFPFGMETHVGADLRRYTPPAKNQRILGLTTADARAEWNGLGVAAPGIDQPVTVSLENKITPNGSSPDFKATFAPATGLLTGSFKLPTSPAVTASFAALIVGDQAVGHYIAPTPAGVPEKRYGHFLLKAPATPAAAP